MSLESVEAGADAGDIVAVRGRFRHRGLDWMLVD